MKIEASFYPININSHLMARDTFGKQLQRWRKARGYNQAELARLLNLSAQYISYLERDFSPTKRGQGKPQPSVEIVDRIARILEIPLAEVRTAAGYAPPESARDIGDAASYQRFTESVFYETYRALESSDPETKKLAVEFLEMLREKARRKRA